MTDQNTITLTLAVSHAERLLSAINSGAVALNDKAANPDESARDSELMSEHWRTFYRGRYRELTELWSIIASLMPEDSDEGTCGATIQETCGATIGTDAICNRPAGHSGGCDV